MTPLAPGKSFGRSISGKMPYLLGPKNALCVPIKNRTTNSPGNPHTPNIRNATTPSSIASDLGNLRETMISPLAVTIGQVPGVAGKQHERDGKDEHRDRLTILVRQPSATTAASTA